MKVIITQESDWMHSDDIPATLEKILGNLAEELDDDADVRIEHDGQVWRWLWDSRARSWFGATP